MSPTGAIDGYCGSYSRGKVMKFECEVWVVLEPIMRDKDIVGAKIANMYKRPADGSIRLSISVPESYFNSPTIKVDLPEKTLEVWDARPLD